MRIFKSNFEKKSIYPKQEIRQLAGFLVFANERL